MQKKVGVTGMIGSGKTTVCKRFNKEYGFPIFYSDIVAKSLYSDSDVQKEVLELIGSLDKKEIAKVIFNNEVKRKAINKIFHTRVYDLFEQFCDDNKEHNVILFESALLLNSKYRFDYTILVDCDMDLKIQRAMKRDDASREAIESRCNSQLELFKDVSIIDFTIDTTNEYDISGIVNKLK